MSKELLRRGQGAPSVSFCTMKELRIRWSSFVGRSCNERAPKLSRRNFDT
jgi:hypothetical protein